MYVHGISHYTRVLTSRLAMGELIITFLGPPVNEFLERKVRTYFDYHAALVMNRNRHSIC